MQEVCPKAIESIAQLTAIIKRRWVLHSSDWKVEDSHQIWQTQGLRTEWGGLQSFTWPKEKLKKKPY